ncbi:hydroquinone glucosyltransferase-like [Prosopis cineraria]|uniref:hydroquinone glucosyltransferase-like n=1 Tax=Prosopis cineraria TaxID=364024 RepID=UPI002410605C|nr:hydroquinone glucosyltransferase-like [Prosopis cineraria]
MHWTLQSNSTSTSLNLKSYVFYFSSATLLSFSLHLPELMVPTGGFRELSQPLELPGCISFRGKDLPGPDLERSCETYKTVLHMFKRLRLADGIIVNSFLDFEPEPIIALQQSNSKFPHIYPVGPILRTESKHINMPASECLMWLDSQPKDSVLYVSFGSGGTLSQDQLHELALGLEMSGHKFLWVVRAPSGDACSAYLTTQKKNDPLDYLPEGFIERTKGEGFVVPSWAPQIEILRHESIGGFLTHCGWNSILEAIFYGKSMIAWPLFADQRMNAVMLTEQFKVALRPKDDENNNGIVERKEVARVVKIAMEGDEGTELRRRIQALKDAALRALGEDGSSTRTVSNLAFE